MPEKPPSPIPGAGLKTVLLIDDDVRLRPVLVEGLEADDDGYFSYGVVGQSDAAAVLEECEDE